MKKKLLLFAALTIVSINLAAQQLSLLNAQTNEPIELATITSTEPEAYTTTNTKGIANISEFKLSKAIEIRSIGFETTTLSYSELEAMQFVFRLSPSNLNLDEVVLSASKWHQASKDLPVKIKTITPKEIALQNPQTTADLLNISGKVFIQKSQQGGGSPIIRGFATNRLLYTIDGVRMNTAIFRGGNIQNVISLDAFSLENTEVLFGPRSVVYGSDAIGGVMNFQSITPQLSLDDEIFISGKATARTSTVNNELTSHFDVNVGWKKWAFVTSVTHSSYDNLRQGSKGPEDYIKDYYVGRGDSSDIVFNQTDRLLQIPSGYKQLNLMQKLVFTPNSDLKFSYGFHYSKTSDFGRYDRHLRLKNGLPRYGEWYYGPQQWMMNNLLVSYQKKTFLFEQVTLNLALQNFDESRFNRNFNSTNKSIRKEHVDAYSINIDFHKTLNRKNALFYGLEYVKNYVTSKGTEENILTGKISDGPSRYPQAEWLSAAVYMNEEYKASNKLTIQSGIRYNIYQLHADFSSQFQPLPFNMASLKKAAVTASIGATYRPAKSWLLSTNIGTAFRSPNVDDMGKIFDSKPENVVIPNPDIQAEYAYNGDVGIAKVFGDVLKIDATAYYTYLDNALSQRPYQLNGQDSIMYDGVLSRVEAVQNASKVIVYGVQAGLEIKLLKGFMISSDYNIQVGREELEDGTESPARHAAPAFGVTRISYKNAKLTLQLYAQYQAKRSFEDMPIGETEKPEIYAKDANGMPYAPAWTTLNLKASYQINNNLFVTGGLENITDQRYRPYSSGISAGGKNFIVSLKAVL